MFAVTLSAQHHEWGVGGGVGGTTLNFDTRNIGIGGNIGLGYTYFFSEQFGLRMGIDFSIFNTTRNDARYSLSETSVLSSQWINMPEGYNFLFTTAVEGFDEQITIAYLNVPIMAVYRPFLRNFYIAGGFKFGVPMFGNHDAKIHQLTTTGYSEFTRKTYANKPSEGFTTFYNLRNENNLDLNLSVKFSFEIGWAWLFSRNREFYLGFYVDQVLNNLSGNSNDFRVQFNGGDFPKINNPTALRATTVGVRLRFARSFVRPTNPRQLWQ